jgi:predicted DCC family thiol-disulfide oxidoreductase YuxK
VKKRAKHLILFDDTCSLCWRSVNRILAWDKKKIFQFSPIKEESSKLFLKQRWKELKNANTLILVENYTSASPKIWIKGRAVMRILWLLGGWRKIPGLLAFVPLGIDALYSFVAKRRHRFR